MASPVHPITEIKLETMTPEIRAAAERLLSRDLAEYQGPTGDEADMRAAIMLARNFMAEHPADDDTPIDREFVRSLGPTNRDDSDCTNVPLCGGVLKARVMWVRSLDGRYHCVVGIAANRSSEWASITTPTRGRVRHLLQSLGVLP